MGNARSGHRRRSLAILIEHVDTATPDGKLVFHIFGALAAFERELIRGRTNTGLAAAHARWRVGGQSKKLANPKQIAMAQALYDSGEHSIADICRALGVSRATLYRAITLPTAGSRTCDAITSLEMTSPTELRPGREAIVFGFVPEHIGRGFGAVFLPPRHAACVGTTLAIARMACLAADIVWRSSARARDLPSAAVQDFRESIQARLREWTPARLAAGWGRGRHGGGSNSLRVG